MLLAFLTISAQSGKLVFQVEQKWLRCWQWSYFEAWSIDVFFAFPKPKILRLHFPDVGIHKTVPCTVWLPSTYYVLSTAVLWRANSFVILPCLGLLGVTILLVSSPTRLDSDISWGKRETTVDSLFNAKRPTWRGVYIRKEWVIAEAIPIKASEQSENGTCQVE